MVTLSDADKLLVNGIVPISAYVEMKRKRIDFVPAGQTPTQAGPQNTSLTSAGDRYLAIVLKDHISQKDPASASGTMENPPAKIPTVQEHMSNVDLCKICSLPMMHTSEVSSTMTRPHEASIAHMVCLEHSQPPSHLDRDRAGLKYLSSFGWDPDSRLGLGASGKGIRVPIKAKMKHDTVGLGVQLKDDPVSRETKKEPLNAKQVRRLDVTKRKKRERLQELFYGDDEVMRYLGEG